MKPLMILILSGMILGGCSTAASGPESQGECMEQGLYKYDNECVVWDDIPLSEQEDVINEIADEIADYQGISKEEALMQMLEVMDEVINK